jgi:hypothetical protein
LVHALHCIGYTYILLAYILCIQSERDQVNNRFRRVETPSISIYTVIPNDDGHDEGVGVEGYLGLTARMNGWKYLSRYGQQHPSWPRHLRGMITEEAARAVGSAAPTCGENSNGLFGQIYCLNSLKIKDDSANYTRQSRTYNCLYEFWRETSVLEIK